MKKKKNADDHDLATEDITIQPDFNGINLTLFPTVIILRPLRSAYFSSTFTWLFLESSLREWIERNKCLRDGKAASRNRRELRNYSSNDYFVGLEIYNVHLELDVFCKLVFLPLTCKVQRKLRRLLSIIIKITSVLLCSPYSKVPMELFTEDVTKRI